MADWERAGIRERMLARFHGLASEEMHWNGENGRDRDCWKIGPWDQQDNRWFVKRAPQGAFTAVDEGTRGNRRERRLRNKDC